MGYDFVAHRLRSSATQYSLLLVSLQNHLWQMVNIILRQPLRYVGKMRQKREDERENQESEIFVSAIVVPLNHQEGPYLIPLIEQAIENIGEGKIKMIVADRGFMCGENLWELKHKKRIDFLIYSKSNMDVTKELKNQMADYKRREKKKLPLPKNYFFQKDKKTEAIVFYLETLQNGQEFGKALRDVSRTKPVIIIKPGHTSLAKKAIGSHTGSLAQDHLLAAALIRENNGILVNSLGELFNALVGLRSNYSNKNKLVILTNAGGPGVIATDYVANTSFQLAKLNPKDKKRFNFLPPESSLENPIDMLGDAKSDRYAKALQGVIKLPQVDNVLVLLTPQVMTDSLRIAEKIVAISKKTNKNIFSSFLGNQRIGRAVEFFNENKFANFTTPAEALGAMDYLVKYKRFRYQKSLPGLPINKRRLDNLKNQLSLQKGLVNFELTRDIMNAFGIKLPAKQLIQAKADIKKLKLLSHKKYVLKIDAKKVIHKKDMGAVVTEITKENVQKQALAMFKKASKLGKGAMLTLEEQYDGREVIAGLKIDPNLGNFILFGLGGTYVEVIKDINFALCPINNEKAKQVVAKSKAFEVLQNFRGAKAINFKQLYQFLVRASYLQILLPEIKEVDFNPVICNERGIYLVDVKIIV